jgi:hypothetical protein
MLTKEQLLKFCDPEGLKIISKPWSKGDYTYSTNGCVIVRIAHHPDIQEGKDASEWGPDAERVFKEAPTPKKWFKIPNLPNETEEEMCGRVMEINGCYFQNQYLHLLKKLPNCQISPIGKDDPAWFKFDGGDGLIMPYRK